MNSHKFDGGAGAAFTDPESILALAPRSGGRPAGRRAAGLPGGALAQRSLSARTEKLAKAARASLVMIRQADA